MKAFPSTDETANRVCRDARLGRTKRNDNRLLVAGGLILLTVTFAAACRMSPAAAPNLAPAAAAEANESTRPPGSPENLDFYVTQLLVYLKTNETELSKMLTDKQIKISGEVWKGGAASFEFWSNAGRIACYGGGSDAGKVAALETAVADYLSKRSNKMPFVRARGVYKKSIPPAAPPNDHWSVVMEECTILDVQ